jgi:thioredoxin-dependent peroxiredoxin
MQTEPVLFCPGFLKKQRMKIFENIWLIFFLVWSLPLTFYRSQFRKIVYRTNSWTINIKPVFLKELKALFGNIYPYDNMYIRKRNIYRMYLAVYLILFSGSMASAHSKNNIMEIKKGDTIPVIVLHDQNGNLFDVKKETAGKNVVLFFYPKDDSPGCTKEACSFRDQYEDFVDANAVVIGISGQSVKSHKDFAEKYHLSYTLLSDEGNKIRKTFGVPTNFFGLLPGRVTYIIDKNGKVADIFNSQTQVNQHVETALDILNKIN